jgi:hypothetical protein
MLQNYKRSSDQDYTNIIKICIYLVIVTSNTKHIAVNREQVKFTVIDGLGVATKSLPKISVRI